MLQNGYRTIMHRRLRPMGNTTVTGMGNTLVTHMGKTLDFYRRKQCRIDKCAVLPFAFLFLLFKEEKQKAGRLIKEAGSLALHRRNALRLRTPCRFDTPALYSQGDHSATRLSYKRLRHVTRPVFHIRPNPRFKSGVSEHSG